MAVCANCVWPSEARTEVKAMARVITYTFAVNEVEGIINLIFVYDKEERESISKKEIEELLNDME